MLYLWDFSKTNGYIDSLFIIDSLVIGSIQLAENQID